MAPKKNSYDIKNIVDDIELSAVKDNKIEYSYEEALEITGK